MPPTNATRSSITIVFSWWQWSGPTHESISHCDLRLLAELVAHEANVRARGPEEPDGRASPEQDAHVDSLRELGEEVAHDDRVRRRA